MAVASAFHDKPLPRGAVAIGEVGLLGEVRDVLQRERRVKEARRLGYKVSVTSKEARTVSEAIRRFVSSSK
jgi:DNA repair protein RadA/Sms